MNRTSLTHHGSESAAENARGAQVPPEWSGRSCARCLPEEPTFNFFTAPFPIQGGKAGAKGAGGFVPSRDLAS